VHLAKGGANICRNLLDFFDMTIDREGRVLVGYVNGLRRRQLRPGRSRRQGQRL